MCAGRRASFNKIFRRMLVDINRQNMQKEFFSNCVLLRLFENKLQIFLKCTLHIVHICRYITCMVLVITHLICTSECYVYKCDHLFAFSFVYKMNAMHIHSSSCTRNFNTIGTTTEKITQQVPTLVLAPMTTI